jgi:cell division protein FtsB
MSDTVLAALVGGVFGFLAAMVPIIRGWRTAPARRVADSILIRESLAEEIARLDRRNKTLEERNDLLDARVGKLEMALRAAGIDPAGIP